MFIIEYNPHPQLFFQDPLRVEQLNTIVIP